MKILVVNTDIYEWEIPEELIPLLNQDDEDGGFQALVDEYFDPENISVAEASDPYYEFKEILEN